MSWFFARNGEVRRLGNILFAQRAPMCGSDGPVDCVEELLRPPIRGVGGGKQNTTCFQQSQGRPYKLPIIAFRPEDSVFARLGKRRWIENDKIVELALFLQPSHPIKGIAVNEIVRRGVESIQFEISPPPLQIFFRQ